jgi:acetylornithine aminotransferase/acetylornithine/N-succinyldiaminopimelate aminotransferase
MESGKHTLELFDRYVVPTYGRFELAFSRGEGSWLWDESGKRYLDFGTGIAVTSLGHCPPRVTARMHQQLQTLVHTSNLYFNQLQGELARKLTQIVGHPGKIFFCNSGAEANEALYKLARKFGNEANGFFRPGAVREGAPDAPFRRTIVTMHGSFHGRTLAGIAATGQDKVKKGFEPLTEGFRYCTLNDVPELEQAAHDASSVAILLEPVQGERGVFAADSGFLKKAQALCEKNSLLLMLDEVQCGLGRTGTWNGWQAIEGSVVPHAISWAKGIAGGFPMGAVWVSAQPIQMRSGEVKPLCDLLGPGSHGTTFGGTPLMCAGALEVLAAIQEEGLVENARKLGVYALEKLRALNSPWVREIRGVGLMIGIELRNDFGSLHPLPAGKLPSIYVVEKLHAAGLLTIPSGSHTIRWLPALNTTAGEVDLATRLLGETLAALDSQS